MHLFLEIVVGVGGVAVGVVVAVIYTVLEGLKPGDVP